MKWLAAVTIAIMVGRQYEALVMATDGIHEVTLRVRFSVGHVVEAIEQSREDRDRDLRVIRELLRR